MAIKITGLGGFDRIGASAAQVEVNGNINKNLLIDSGVSMNNKRGADGNTMTRSQGHIPPTATINSVLITHGHSDHHSNLPHLWPGIIENDSNAKVYMTKPTFHTAGNLWLNTSYLLDRGEILAGIDYRANFAKGMRMILQQSVGNMIEKPGWVEIFPGVEAYFGPNGHIRGSAFIVLKVDGKQIMFSGDMSVYDSPTVKGMKVPEEFVGRLDAIFVESTYGDRVLRPRIDEEERMAYIAKETINRGGICLAPAFGVGRSPDAVLAQAMRGVKPLYLDGMGKTFLDVCTSSDGQWCELDQMPQLDSPDAAGICYVGGRDEREDMIYEGRPLSVVATAGMMVRGSCAWQYATRGKFLQRPENTVLQTGYQAENSEGWALHEAASHGTPFAIDGLRVPVLAQVPERLQLSSHADGMQIADIVCKLQPRKVFIGHGNDNGREGLKNNLLNLGFSGEIHLPRNGDAIEI